MIDTPAKRRAMMGVSVPMLPIPSGTSDAMSRLTLLRIYYIAPIVIASSAFDWCISDTALYACTLTDATLHQWSLVDATRDCD